MSHQDQLIAEDIEAYLDKHQHKSLLRFITCGSVDDGKSTLIGRLLYDSKMIFDDQLAALESDSRRVGTQGQNIDFALLVDGLAAEREQGITIDVAYRFFSTEKRKFIVADTPGHEQYTRNMVTGASTADLAVILIDARKGVLTQTRRHSYLAHLLGIRNLVLAVNKMDLVDWSKDRFDEIVADYAAFGRELGIGGFLAIPISGLDGDNIASKSERTPWYAGPSLIEHLETVELDESRLQRAAFRLPVQWVNRPNLDFRGFCGQIASGVVKPGDRIRIANSGRDSRVKDVWLAGERLDRGVAGQSVTITLDDEIDCSRGDVIASADAAPEVADQFETTIVWMSDEHLLPGRSYLLKAGARTVTATVTDIKHQVDVNSLEHLAAKDLELNGIAVCNISTDQPLAFDPYADNPTTGGFILIDRLSNATVGAGMIHFALRRAHNIHWQALDVDRSARAGLKGQKPAVLWFTGLSGAGKSTIANLVEKKLHSDGRHTYLLDGDNVRHGLNRDLGFTDADRVENIRRVAEVARLMADAGLIVLTSFISPFRAERRMAREMMSGGEFFEVFVDAPLSVAEARDVKGLYKKARSGQLKNFTGIDSPYEAPEAPEIRIDTTAMAPEEAATAVCQALTRAGVLKGYVEDFWVFFAVGFLAQLIDGAMGMAYGVVSASMLMTFGVPPANVSASVHAAKVFTGAASATSHTLARNVDVGLMVRLAIAGVIGGVIGAYVLTGLDASVMRPFMAGWLGLMGLFILYRAWRSAPPRTVPFKAPLPLGLVGGLMDALGGGGWGPTVTSTLIGAGSAPRHAIGTANTAEFFVAVATSIAFLTALLTGRWEQADDLLTHAWAIGGLIAGGVLAAPFASLITKFLPVRGMMWAVGVLVVALCGYQFWRVFAGG